MCETFASLLTEAAARVCKCYSRQMPLEQCDAQLLLEGAHPPADRGMPHAERTCSRPKAQMFCDGECLLDRDRVSGRWVGSPGRWFAARHVCAFPQHAANPWARRARSCGCSVSSSRKTQRRSVIDLPAIAAPVDRNPGAEDNERSLSGSIDKGHDAFRAP